MGLVVLLSGGSEGVQTVQFLENLLNKPNGISIIEKQIPFPSKTVFSLDDIAEIEDANRTKYNDSGILAVHLFIVF